MKMFLKNGDDFMIETDKNNFAKIIIDLEKVMLIETSEDEVYLLADIENEEIPRIEIMNFIMDTSLNFIDSNSDSRNCNKSIYFIEFDENTNNEKILETFLKPQAYLVSLTNIETIFLLCSDIELKNILSKYKNKRVYIYVKN